MRDNTLLELIMTILVTNARGVFVSTVASFISQIRDRRNVKEAAGKY